MFQAKDVERIAEMFAPNATLSFYNTSAHNKNTVAAWASMNGKEMIKGYFASELKSLEQVRPVGLYPDFGRKGGMMHMEVFARCPHSGMLFSSTWIIEAF